MRSTIFKNQSHGLVVEAHGRAEVFPPRTSRRSFQVVIDQFGSYTTQVRIVTGTAGSVLLENAELFHWQLAARVPRVASIKVFSTSGGPSCRLERILDRCGVPMNSGGLGVEAGTAHERRFYFIS
jgi:hypothetical protein